MFGAFIHRPQLGPHGGRLPFAGAEQQSLENTGAEPGGGPRPLNRRSLAGLRVDEMNRVRLIASVLAVAATASFARAPLEPTARAHLVRIGLCVRAAAQLPVVRWHNDRSY
jgi:hypothetical protein